MSYEHLRLEREAPLTEIHKKRYMDGPPPADVRAHGAHLAQRLQQVRRPELAEDVGGFDDRKLLKIRLQPGDKSVPRFDRIPGVEIVSQEYESIVLAFATADGLAEFESRLATLARGDTVTRKELLYASHRRLRSMDAAGPYGRSPARARVSCPRVVRAGR